MQELLDILLKRLGTLNEEEYQRFLRRINEINKQIEFRRAQIRESKIKNID
jgi:tetrahydromethanopterin S-methyltransferase subunit G